LSKVAAR